MQHTGRQSGFVGGLRRTLAKISTISIFTTSVVAGLVLAAPVAEAANVTQSPDGTLTYEFNKGNFEVEAGDFIAGGYSLRVPDRPAGGVTVTLTNGSMSFPVTCADGTTTTIVAPIADRTYFIDDAGQYPVHDDKDPSVYAGNWHEIAAGTCGGGKIAANTAILRVKLTSSPTLTRLTVNTAYAYGKKVRCESSGQFGGGAKNCFASSWAGNVDGFTVAPVAPSYVCLNATDVTQTTATFRGETSDMNVAGAVFTLNPAGNVGATTIVDGGAGKLVSAPATGLTPNTTYTYSISFRNAAGAQVGASAPGCAFTTPPVVNPPSYLCVSAADITQSSATLRGETSNTNVTTAVFTLTPAGGTVGATTIVDGGAGKLVSAPATGLTPNTTYTYSISFRNAAGAQVGASAAGPACTFTTAPLAPTYVCLSATGITPTAATLRGETSNPSVTGATFTLTPVGATVGATTIVGGGAGQIVSAPATGLTPGTTYTYSISFTGAAGQLGTSAAGPACTFTTSVANPAIRIIKYVNTDDANTAPGVLVTGSTMSFEMVVTNIGDVALTNVTVTDNVLPASAISCNGPGTSNVRAGTVAPGGSFTCTATLPAPAAGTTHSNLATVVGTTPNNTTVTDDDPANAHVPPATQGTPGISIIKKVNGFDANDAPGVTVAVGSTLNFTYEVYNTGTVVLSNVQVTDQVLVGGSSNVVVTCPATVLAVSSVPMICTGSAPAPATGQYTNVGTVVGTPPAGPPVTDDDPANAFVATPGIEIIKYVNGADANDAPGLPVQAGDAVTWTYQVTNTGNVDLINVTVTDNKGVTVDCGGSNVIAVLRVKEQKVCTGTGIAILGQYTNTGIAVGTPNPPLLPGQPPIPTPPVTDQDDANYIGNPVAVVLPPAAEIPAGELPATGSNSSELLTLAAGLLLVGGLLFAGTRRRRTA